MSKRGTSSSTPAAKFHGPAGSVSSESGLQILRVVISNLSLDGALELFRFLPPEEQRALSNVLDGRRKHTKRVLAHRFAYRLEHGDAALPDDICLLHLVCDNPPCCNPRHTRPGTRADNVKDMDMKHRRVPARGERQHGHKLSYEMADTIRWSHRI